MFTHVLHQCGCQYLTFQKRSLPVRSETTQLCWAISAAHAPAGTHKDTHTQNLAKYAVMLMVLTLINIARSPFPSLARPCAHTGTHTRTAHNSKHAGPISAITRAVCDKVATPLVRTDSHGPGHVKTIQLDPVIPNDSLITWVFGGVLGLQEGNHRPGLKATKL